MLKQKLMLTKVRPEKIETNVNTKQAIKIFSDNFCDSSCIYRAFQSVICRKSADRPRNSSYVSQNKMLIFVALSQTDLDFKTL